MSIYTQFEAISAKMDREEATKKIADMSPQELREYRKLHPLKGRGKGKGKAAPHHNPLAPTVHKAPPAPPKAKMPAAPKAASTKKDKAPPAPKTHMEKAPAKKPVVHKGETPHEPRKDATATPVAEHKEPKRGSLGHHEAIDYVGKTLGFNRKATPSPYNDTDDVTHEASGDRTKDLAKHLKHLGYKKLSSQNYGQGEMHVYQHPHDLGKQVTFMHHPASDGGEGMTVMR